MGPRFRILPEMVQWVRFRIEMNVPSDLAYVGPAAGYLSKMARGHGFPESVWAERLPLVVDEALSNAMRHGHGLDPAREVKVEAVLEEGALVIRVEDGGPGFDPDSLPDPSEEAGRLRSNGRGVFLIRKLSDEAEFLEGGRVVLMRFKRS